MKKTTVVKIFLTLITVLSLLGAFVLLFTGNLQTVTHLAI